MAAIPSVKLGSPEFKADPFPFYALLRAEAPCHRVTLPDKQPAWLVTRYDDVVALLKDERFAKDRLNAMTAEQVARQPWMPGMLKPLARNMLDLDVPDHTRLRGLVHKVFTPRLIETMRDRIQRLTHELIDAAERKGRMDLIHDYAVPVPTTIIAEMLGIPASDHQKFHRWTSRIVSSSGPGMAGLLAMPDILLFLRYVRRLIQMRRSNPQDDLITALVQVSEEGDQLSEDELVAMIVLLIIAGHETTLNLIGNGMLTLMQHPDQMNRLQTNPSLIRSAVEELARFAPPVELATERYAREDVTIHGVTIPRGALVFGVIGSANRDEQQFVHADKLDIMRDPNRHLAFGQGIHYCLGAPLARLEVQIAIQTLLERVPDIRLAGPALGLRWNRGLVVRGLQALPVTLRRQRISA